MPTLSIIKMGNKCAYTHTGEEIEITGMLTQCALRDELLAQAITQSALNIIRTTAKYKSDALGMTAMLEDQEL